MFSRSQLQSVEDEQLDLYMDWLLEAISQCEAEADKTCPEIRNEVFFQLKLRMMLQELKQHRRELRRILDEKKRRLHWWCH